VQAARRQGSAAQERLDLGLRRAFFAESRCIALRHEILEVAERCDLDVDALASAIDDGVARRAVIDGWRTATHDDSEVRGSPHVFLSDGSDALNPGIRMHWTGEEGEGVPVVDADDASVHRDLLAAAVRRGP
jgi:predicted DsbA family dithiol-disulfide isomerase